MSKWVKYILIGIAIIAVFAIAKVAGKFVFKTGNEITKNVFGDNSRQNGVSFPSKP